VLAERMFSIVPAAMLVVAPAPWPYVYYVLLRWVVLICVGTVAFQSFQRRGWQGWTIALVLFVVVFNPVVPFHFDRAIWSVLNVSGSALLIAHLWFERGWRAVK